MSKDSNLQIQFKEIVSINEIQNKNDTSYDIFEDSQEVDCSDSESIMIDKKGQRILKTSKNSDEILNFERKDISTDGEFKDSFREKNNTNEKKILPQKQFDESELIQDSIRKSKLKSQILAHYKLGEDQQIFRIDIKNENNQIIKQNQKQKNSHWQPIKVPDDLFADQQIIDTQNNNVEKSKARTFHQKNSQQSIKDVNKDQIPTDNKNLLNPFTYLKAFRQQESMKSFSCQPFNQPAQNMNCQPQSPTFFPQNMGQPQFNQPMQYSQSANFVHPFSPRSDAYWQPGPLPQQQPPYPAFYGGVQLMNQMRYLRQEVKMLRESINYQRNERQFQTRYKRQNNNDFDRFQKMIYDMKKTIDSQRQEHKRQIQVISKKFTQEIMQLRQSNESLRQQNETLRLITESPIKDINQTNKSKLKQKNDEKSGKKSSRKIIDLQQILGKKIYPNNNGQSRKINTSRTHKQIEHKKKPQNTPQRKKESVKKSN